MSNRGKGSSLYSTLADVGFPHLNKFSPEALDWLYEDADSRRLFDWISENVTNHNYLSDEELEAYSQIPKSELLSGDVLDAALEAAVDADSDLSVEDLERKISKLETELGWYEDSVETIFQVKNSLVEKNNTDSVELDRLRLEAERESRTERKVQEHVLEVNSQFNAALHNLGSSLENLIGEYSSDHPDDAPGTDSRVHLANLNLDRIQQKEEELDKEVGKLLNAFFGSKFSELGIGGDIEVENDRIPDLLDESVVELVRGRDNAEFLHLRSEIDRIRVSLCCAEIERIENLARVEGAAAALSLLQRQSTHIQPNLIDHPSLDAVSRPQPIIVESNSKLNSQISSLVSQCVNCHYQKILTTDYKTAYGRSKYIINKLKLIRDDVLQRRARQEILDVLFVNETDQILELVSIMDNLVDSLELQYRRRVGFKTAVQGLVPSKKTEGLILPQDSTFSNLHSLLRVSGHAEAMSTYAGLESTLKGLLSERRRLEENQQRRQSSRLQNLREAEAGIRKLTSSLSLTSEAPLRGVSLVPKEISLGTSRLDRGIKELEVKLKNLLTEWERQKSDLKNKSYHRQQRDLWMEFLLRPEILPANIRAVQNKAKD